MIDVKEIAEAFGLKIVGDENQFVERATAIDNQVEHGITWVKNEKWISQVKSGVVLMHESLFTKSDPAVTYLLTPADPKLTFSLILKKYFTPPVDYYLKNCVDKHSGNSRLTIADHVFIGQNVTIGDGTIIFPHVFIEANSVIGEKCIIKSHVSIGTEGMGLEFNPENGLLEKFPQIGNTVLEDFVEIGPHSTVRRGALKTTRIGRGSKIGSMTNIGHNCEVGTNCIFTAGIVVSGSSKIGNDVFIGVNACIRNAVNIGDRAEVGMGSVVVKDVPAESTVIGNPAKLKV